MIFTFKEKTEKIPACSWTAWGLWTPCDISCGEGRSWKFKVEVGKYCDSDAFDTKSRSCQLRECVRKYTVLAYFN